MEISRGQFITKAAGLVAGSSLLQQSVEANETRGGGSKSLEILTEALDYSPASSLKQLARASVTDYYGGHPNSVIVRGGVKIMVQQPKLIISNQVIQDAPNTYRGGEYQIRHTDPAVKLLHPRQNLRLYLPMKIF